MTASIRPPRSSDMSSSFKKQTPTLRLSYDDSCRLLQSQQIIDAGELPPMPARPPRHDDEVLGVSFFRTELADAKLENLMLPRTFFGRSEIRATLFSNTDLSESTANWNDFLNVDFSFADLSRCDFRANIFQKVRFTGARLVGADLRRASFTGCDFADADFTGAKLTKLAAASLGLSSVQQGVIDWQADDGAEPPGG